MAVLHLRTSTMLLLCWVIPFLAVGQFREQYKDQQDEPSKIITMMEGSVLVGQSVNNPEYGADFNLQFIAGYEGLDHWIFGIGTGPELYEGHVGVPLYITVRGYLDKSVLKPFFMANAGYSMGMRKNARIFTNPINEVKGGYRFNPGFGLQLPAQKHNWYFTVGYLLQKVSYVYYGRLDAGYQAQLNTRSIRPNPYFNEKIIEERLIRRGSIQIGVKF